MNIYAHLRQQLRHGVGRLLKQNRLIVVAPSIHEDTKRLFRVEMEHGGCLHVLNAVDVAAEAKLAALHLPLVLLEFGSLLLLARQQGGVLALSGAALLNAAEDEETDEDTEDGKSADDDTALCASGQGFPVVAHAGRVLDLLEDFGLRLRAALC